MTKLNTTNQMVAEFARVFDLKPDAVRPDETVYCRFTREPLRVVSCNGCVATLSDGTTRPVGELTRIGG